MTKDNVLAHINKKTALKVLGITVGTVILICCLYGAYLFAINYKNLPDWQDITMDEKSYLYDSDGKALVYISGTEDREVIDYNEFAPNLINAVIATEDARFYKHGGIDYIRIFGALIADLKSGSPDQGASTLTMQLARNAILENSDKNINRKIQEALLAKKIEKHYTKEEIAALYLNEIYMGNGAYGMEAAAEKYFGKSASDLNLGECATLAGIIRSPYYYNPIYDYDKAINRRNVVLDNMVKEGFIDEATAEATKEEEITVADENADNNLDDYSWFTDYAIEEAANILGDLGYAEGSLFTGGFRVYTTLDTKTQDKADTVYNDGNNFPDGVGEDQLQSACLFMEPGTGYIRAMEGGRKYSTRFGWNRATDMLRQPGSVIKPVAVYGPAINEGYSPYYLVNDVKYTYNNGTYTPENYDSTYRGLITMTTACKLSVNTVAVKMLDTIGIDIGWKFAKSCGLALTDKDKNLALALGGLTNGVSLLNLATAYSSFANGGYRIEPTSIIKITDKNGSVIYENKIQKERAMKDTTAYAVNMMLEETIKSGTGTKAALGCAAAGKTGTTQLPDAFGSIKGNKDSWWAGYTPDLVGIVWMGFDNDYSPSGKQQYMVNVYGGQYPAIVWKEIMETALENSEKGDFERPDGYSTAIFQKGGSSTFSSKTTITICNESGLLAKGDCPSTSRVSVLRSEAPTRYCNIHGYSTNHNTQNNNNSDDKNNNSETDNKTKPNKEDINSKPNNNDDNKNPSIPNENNKPSDTPTNDDDSNNTDNPAPSNPDEVTIPEEVSSLILKYHFKFGVILPLFSKLIPM